MRKALGALMLVVALGIGTTTLAPDNALEAAADTTCPPIWTWPGIGNGEPVYDDYNIATYVGGDFSVFASSAEAEGRTVVMGTSLFNRTPPGLFNLGRVGVGSQVAPPPGATMLLTGSTLDDDLVLTPGNRLDVGHRVNDGGGVHVAGTVVPSVAEIETNGGTVEYLLGAAATQQYAGVGAQIIDLADQLAARAVNGAVSVAGNQLTFTGTGEPGVQQVFAVSAAQLGQPTVEIHFVGIPDETSVVINVTGATASFTPTFFSDDGVRVDDFNSPGFPIVAVRTLWNFADATELHLAGTSQVLGSILVPRGDVDVSSSTNGRMLVGGNLTMEGDGNELHSYHWPGSPVTECLDQETLPEEPTDVGVISILKVIAAGADMLPSPPLFEGLIECPMPDGTIVAEQWTVGAGAVDVLGGLPVGAVCTVSEVTPAAPPGPGTVWAPPEMTPADGRVTVPDPGSPGAAVTVTVTNTPVGPFTVRKAVRGPDGTSDGFDSPGRVFPIAYECVLGGAPVDGRDPATLELIPGSAAGSLSVTVEQATSSLAYPLGTVCELTEELVSDPGGVPDFTNGSHWASVEFAPSDTVTIGVDPSATEVIVTNNFDTPETPLLGFTLQKQIVGPEGGLAENAPPFEVTFVCTLDGDQAVGFDPEDPTEIVAPTGEGLLFVTAGAPAVLSPLFPAGTECTLAESPRVDEEDFVSSDYRWVSAAFSPSSTFALTEGASVEIVLTNTFEKLDVPDPGSGSGGGAGAIATTGSEAPLGLASLAVILMLAGGVLVVARRRRAAEA